MVNNDEWFTRETILEVNGARENMQICMKTIASVTEIMMMRGFPNLKDAKKIWEVLLTLEKDVYFYIFKYEDFENKYNYILENESREKSQFLVERVNKLVFGCFEKINNELSKIFVVLFGNPKVLNGENHEWKNSEVKKRNEKTLKFADFIFDNAIAYIKNYSKKINDDCDLLAKLKYSRVEVVNNKELYFQMVEKRNQLFFDASYFLSLEKISSFVKDILKKVMAFIFENNIDPHYGFLEKCTSFLNLFAEFSSLSNRIQSELGKIMWLCDIELS